MKARAVGYIRVSTENQVEEGLSLDIQREAITSYCNKQKYELLRIYEDPGVSGATLDRPALLSLLESAKANEFDIVVIYQLDRLARDLYTQLFIEKELEVAEVELYSVCEPDINRNDPMTVALRQMKGVFAQYEKEMIRLRLTAGRLKKFRDGGYAGGSPALGYTPRREGRAHSKLEVDKEEAKVVRYIKKLRRQGLSLREIALRLTEEGIPTKRGGEWYPATIRYILMNPLYKGKIRYDKTVGDGKQSSIGIR